MSEPEKEKPKKEKQPKKKKKSLWTRIIDIIIDFIT